MTGNRSGFTLTEVMATSTILIVLGTVAVSGFKSALPAYRLKAAARDLYSHMQMAKMTAIKNNTNCSITYGTTPDRYQSSATGKVVMLSDYGRTIRFEGPQGQTFAVSTITFNPMGTCNAGYAYLSDEENTAYYRVGPWSSGIIKLHSYPSEEWPEQ
ncbi:MAG: hypothetical protein C4576_23220 [Desulfobacteraceae bacterium]|nr:MAG: hypothetical protein C4576_23220 [Desulfobacteraceae bacterium]